MSLAAEADPTALLVLCTCPEADVARTIARTLVAEHLAACVNRVPGVASLYEWEGQICEATEELLVIKTTRAAYASLEMRLRALHPYEIPEIIAIPVATGSRQYLAWLGAAVSKVSVQPL